VIAGSEGISLFFLSLMLIIICKKNKIWTGRDNENDGQQLFIKKKKQDEKFLIRLVRKEGEL